MFTVASVAVVVLNDRAGERTATAGQIADGYRRLEVALLREEVARHHLPLEGGSTAEVVSTQRLVARMWARVQSIGDTEHEAERRKLEQNLSAYQTAVSRLASDHQGARHDGARERDADLVSRAGSSL